MKFEQNEIKKILIIKFGGIGDILLSTPVLPNLRNYFPDAKIYYLTLRHSRDILNENPFIDRVITYDPLEDHSRCLIDNIRNQKYDLIIDLYCNPRTALVTYLSKAKYRFGFNFRGRKYAYNLKTDGRGGDVHNVEFNLDALRYLEIPILSKEMYLPMNTVHYEFADSFLKKNNLLNKTLVGVTLTGGWETKKYKVNDYIELIKKLNEIYDLSFILIWGNEKEKEECKEINNAIPENTYLIPDSPIRYLGAIISNCTFIIGNDSGPLHISAAVGTPVLGIYGPTNPKLQGPYGDKNLTIVNENLECLGCNLLECEIGNICMTKLSKDLILDKVKHLTDINNIKLKLK
ncbi:MAG TPA: glycosyltransferase family 9 protein [Ignavibacteria bacterium]|nr:glycosyltransferase family 9 protein [Ignavibacteria bacterium]